MLRSGRVSVVNLSLAAAAVLLWGLVLFEVFSRRADHAPPPAATPPARGGRAAPSQEVEQQPAPSNSPARTGQPAVNEVLDC